MRDVAARAGVGAITVSRFFANPSSVSTTLATRIAKAVRELDYVPNRIAGGLASVRARVIPVIVPSLANAVYANIIQGIHDVLIPQGYQILLGHTSFSLAEEEALVATFLGWFPQGMILTGIDHTPHTRRLLLSARIPIVETMELGANPLDINVGFSHVQAGYAMTERLIELGYRRIAFAGSRLEQDVRAARRCEGYLSALRRHDLPTELILRFPTPTTYEQGAKAVEWLLTQRPRVDAVFCHHDVLAVGVLLECQRQHIEVPKCLAVAGFNGLDISAAVTPRLTTVVSPRYQIGQLSAELLLHRLRGEAIDRQVDVGFEIIERETTCPRQLSGRARKNTETDRKAPKGPPVL
jgi:LacI family gluconate utilization system Gnt-I transcriptional repressor